MITKRNKIISNKKNIIKSEIFQEKLAEIIDSYNKVSVPEAMLHTIIQLAKEINLSKTSNINLGLSPEEEAFYDALYVDHKILLVNMIKKI